MEKITLSNDRIATVSCFVAMEPPKPFYDLSVALSDLIDTEFHARRLAKALKAWQETLTERGSDGSLRTDLVHLLSGGELLPLLNNVTLELVACQVLGQLESKLRLATSDFKRAAEALP